MIYGKINETNNTYPLELQLGLKALRKVLETKNFTIGEEILVNSWMRIIPQGAKKGMGDVNSEVHARYHDIFYLAQGRELTVFQGNMSFEKAFETFGLAEGRSDSFNTEKDIGFVGLDTSKNAQLNVLDSEHFIHYTPGDLHASQISFDPKEDVVKLVVKILDKSFLTEDLLNAFEDDLAKL